MRMVLRATFKAHVQSWTTVVEGKLPGAWMRPLSERLRESMRKTGVLLCA